MGPWVGRENKFFSSRQLGTWNGARGMERVRDIPRERELRCAVLAGCQWFLWCGSGDGRADGSPVAMWPAAPVIRADPFDLKDFLFAFSTRRAFPQLILLFRS